MKRGPRPRPGLEGLALRPVIKPKQTFVMADITGRGAIQQIWMTPAGTWRFAILRFYWDGETEPSVECPVGDFFACGWGEYAQISSLAVCVNPGQRVQLLLGDAVPQRASRSRREHRRSLARRSATTNQFTVYYQINYTLTDVPDDAAYFHAQFRRVNPLPYKDVYTILDGVKGWGHYVGTYMAWGVNNNGWWGEGEIKFFMDGDKEVPDDLRHGHGGLFLRLLRLRQPRPRTARSSTTSSRRPTPGCRR